jgi:hypothetical protein
LNTIRKGRAAMSAAAIPVVGEVHRQMLDLLGAASLLG